MESDSAQLCTLQAPAAVMVPTSATTLSEVPSCGAATPSCLNLQALSLQSGASALAAPPLPPLDAGLGFNLGGCDDLLDEREASFAAASGESMHSDFTGVPRCSCAPGEE